MAYFNGSGGYNLFDGTRVPFVPADRIYCDDCGESEIPPPPKTGKMGPGGDGARHHNTGFKWAPFYGGDTKCKCCGKAV